MAWFRAFRIVASIFIVTLAILPVHLFYMATKNPARKRTALKWHQTAAHIMSLKVIVKGAPATADGHGVLFVANHISWLDIIALGASTELSFIAKDDVRSWPVFGTLARLQQSVFVARENRSTVARQAAEIHQRLKVGDNLVLFPEGTTSCGNFVYPFKSSLIGALDLTGQGDNTPDTLQPVGIAYTRLHGLPMGRYHRQIASWPGDIEMFPHLLSVLKNGVIDVEITFGEPIKIDAQWDRKQLTRHTQHHVSSLVSASLRGLV